MEKWVIHSYTDYCGTDNYEVVEAETEYDAEEMGHTIAYDNATAYYDVISDEDYETYDLEGQDMENYITDEQYGFSVELYDENLHADLI